MIWILGVILIVLAYNVGYSHGWNRMAKKYAARLDEVEAKAKDHVAFLSLVEKELERRGVMLSPSRIPQRRMDA